MELMRLEPLQRHKALGQAVQLGKLVAANNDWLPASPYAGAYERYGHDPVKGVRNVARLAGGRSNGFYAFMATAARPGSQRRQAIGLATAIAGITVDHPVAGSHTGMDLDYWLHGDYDGEPTAHRKIAELLLDRAVRISAAEADGNSTMMATVIPGLSHQPVGFKDYMQPVGGPAELRSPQAGALTEAEIVKNGRQLQLYITHRPVAV